MDMLEKAARAARVEAGRLRKNRISDYPGGPKVRDGLGWENLDDVSESIVRAVLLAIREPDEAIKDKITIGGWIEDELKYDDVWQGTIDAILTTSATKETTK